MKELTTGNKPKPIQPTAVFTEKEWARRKRAYAFRDIYGMNPNSSFSDLWAEMRDYDWKRPSE